MLVQLTQKVGTIRTDLQVLQERTKTVAQTTKIAESQTLILAKFAGKPEPNPVADMKMMRSTEGTPEELDYSNAPTPNYTVEDLIPRLALSSPNV